MAIGNRLIAQGDVEDARPSLFACDAGPAGGELRRARRPGRDARLPDPRRPQRRGVRVATARAPWELSERLTGVRFGAALEHSAY